VIQRFAGSLLALLLLTPGCAQHAPRDVPRSLRGATLRGAFVPPGAYEAYLRGELLLARGRPTEAAAQFDLATTAPEEDPYLLSRLAHAQLLAGERALAEQTLAHAAGLDPCAEAIWLMRGELAASRGDDDTARAAFERASACAPGSDEGALALAALLAERGDATGSLDVLVDAAERTGADLAPQALRRSLRASTGAELAHALASLGSERVPDGMTLERAIALALERGQPRLSLRLRDQHAARLPPALEARLLQANGLREELAALLAQHDARELGGAASTAALALDAGAYERAALESESALAARPSDALHALHARATMALGDQRGALADARAIGAPGLRFTVIGEVLASLGAPALGGEVGAREAR
jgi:tetratricopeptide (TPR) repeat protein